MCSLSKLRWKSLKKKMYCLLLSLLLVSCGTQVNKEEETYRQYGIHCLESGKYEEAIDSFQKALDQSMGKVGERELDICFYKARAHYLNSEWEEALSIYNSIIEYNENARAYYLRGCLYMNSGEEALGLSDFEMAVKEDKDDYEIYLGIYENLVSHNKMDRALSYLELAQGIKGEEGVDYFYKGRILYLKKEYEAAIEALQKALEKEENVASYYLGLVYEQKGETEKADIYIKQYLNSGNATSYDLYQLGCNEAASGNYAKAAQYYEAGLALENVPNKQNLMKGAIAAYEYSGDFASAKKMVGEYLKLYPNDEEAKKEEIFLKTR